MMDRHDRPPACGDVHLSGSRLSLVQGISYSPAPENSGRILASEDGQHDDHEVDNQTPMYVGQDVKRKSSINLSGVPNVDKASSPYRRGSSLRLKILQNGGHSVLEQGSQPAAAGTQEMFGSDRLPFLILHPFSIPRFMWDILMFCLLIYSIVTVPYYIAFPDNNPVSAADTDACANTDFLKQALPFYVDFTFDCLFLVDVIVTFRTAYYDIRASSPELVTDGKRIAWKYVSGGLFWIDLVSSIPFDAILLKVCLASGGANRMLKGPKAAKLLKMIRMIRLMRVSRMSTIVVNIRDVLSLNPGTVRLATFVVCVMMFAHYNACIFYFIGEYSLDFDSGAEHDIYSWTTQVSMEVGNYTEMTVHDMRAENAYLVSVYWAVTTMTTVGYGDITPKNIYEVMFTILALLEGGVIFSIVIGNLAKLLQHLNLRYHRFCLDMEVIENFMFREEFPSEMKSRVKLEARQQYLEPARKIPSWAMESISGSLKRDISMHVYRKPLLQLPMFLNLSEKCITEIAMALQPVQFAAHQVIYYEDEEGDCIYFLHSGVIEMSMLLLDKERKERYGSQIVPDPAFKDCFDKKFKPRFPSGSVHWTGVNSSKYNFFRWTIGANGNFWKVMGEEVINTGETTTRRATAVTKSFVQCLILPKSAILNLCGKFPELAKKFDRIVKPNHQLFKKIVKKVVVAIKEKSVKPIGFIEVHLSAVINLPNNNLKRCNPYCKVAILEHHPLKSVHKWPERTSLTQYNTHNPWFGECFRFPVTSLDQLKGSATRLKIRVQVWDHSFNSEGLNMMLGEFECDMPDYATEINSGTGKVEIKTNLDPSAKSLVKDFPEDEFYMGKKRWFELPLHIKSVKNAYAGSNAAYHLDFWGFFKKESKVLFSVEIIGVPKEKAILHGEKASYSSGSVVLWHRQNSQYEKQQKALKIQSEHESKEQMCMAFEMRETAIIPHNSPKSRIPQTIDVLANKRGFAEDSLEESAFSGIPLQLEIDQEIKALRESLLGKVPVTPLSTIPHSIGQEDIGRILRAFREQTIHYEHVLSNMEDKIFHVQGHVTGSETGGLAPVPSPSKFFIKAIHSQPDTGNGTLDDQVQSYISVLKTLQARGEGKILLEEMQRMKTLQELVKERS